ncbi:MAG TPA: hypothetical protein VMG58_10505 [Candidatus Sulfotelmatobacter sp.]|nr:hypothetical protein [Candidatus Sulfotelmatobacter sp.]
MIDRASWWSVRTALVALVAVLAVSLPAGAAEPAKEILALGSFGFLDEAGVLAATGARLKQEVGSGDLKDQFKVIVLANVAFDALPEAVQVGLPGFVRAGGALLITGGPQSFGSGGYDAIAELVPFELRNRSDFRVMPFRSPVPLQPDHPVLAGVRFETIGALNDMNPRPGATEILRMSGGGNAGYPYPLIAEIAVGSGRVLGFAFDLADLGGMPDRDRLMQNALSYLSDAAR